MDSYVDEETGIMDTMKSGCSSFFHGIYHSARGFVTFFFVDSELEKRRMARISPSRSKSNSKDQSSQTLPSKEENTVRSRILYCGILNGAIFLGFMYFFEYAVFPLLYYSIALFVGKDSARLQSTWHWFAMVVDILYKSFWVAPLFAITKVINNLWFQDVGQSAFKYSKGRTAVKLTLSQTIADFIFSTVVETLFLIQALLITYCPISLLGRLFNIVHLSLLYSLYAFEYKWAEMGWETHKRLTLIERNWPYYLGFGLPLVLSTQYCESLFVNASIFSILFPLFIISANEANPKECEVSRIPIFSPVVAVSNSLFSVLGKTKKKSASKRPTTPRR